MTLVSSLVDTKDDVQSANRMIAVMRLILAISALTVIYLYPTEPDRFVTIVYALLGLYTLHSAILCLVLWQPGRLAKFLYRWTHWFDVMWYTLFVALSSGTNSFFFFGYFFAVLVASFRWGFREGFIVTTFSNLSFIIVSLLARPYNVEFEHNRFLLRSVSFLLLGYMVAYWGNSEIGLRKRLELLKDVSRLSNPRFGIDRTISSVLEKLRVFYDANACLLITANRAKGTFTLRRTDCQHPEAAIGDEPLAEELAIKMLTLPADYACIYRRRPNRLERLFPNYYTDGSSTGRLNDKSLTLCENLATVLDANAFMTVPLKTLREVESRLFLTARHRFTVPDMQFLLQVTAQLQPVLENIRLVDRMASQAAEVERRRIALDIHDNFIQPYVGLQLGLASVHRKLTAGDASAISDVERLNDLTNTGIADLRSYVSALKDGFESDGNLMSAIKRFAAKFTDATQIEVLVDAEETASVIGQIPDRLAAAVFQIVVEALGNVRRHTHATQATVSLAHQSGHLIVRIENEAEKSSPPAPFTPHSIAERAATLGGHIHVEPSENDRTVITVEIPL